jgi:hypothetical protein
MRKYKFDFLGVVPDAKRGQSATVIMVSKDGSKSVETMPDALKAGNYGVIVEGTDGDTVHIEMVPLHYDRQGKLVHSDSIFVDLMPQAFQPPLTNLDFLFKKHAK